MSFTVTNPANIFSADTMITRHGMSMLSFQNELGVSVINIHNIPTEVAEATAKAFSEGMEKHRAELVE